MAVTKTDFINYTKCRRYAALEEIKKDKLESLLSIEEYKKEENNEIISEILGNMYEIDDDGEEIDLTVKKDKQLEAMLGFYKEVEILAAKHVQKLFGGSSIFSEDTYRQESFDFTLNGIRYLCFVDIYNEAEDVINIIEVKATTDRKYLELEYGKRRGDKYSLFTFENGIYHLNKKDIDEDNEKNYYEKINKLKDRFSDCGKYIYDLAVQRYIIENDFKSRNISKKVNYFLAVLNSSYTYDGYTENGKRVYRPDEKGNEIISIFDFNDITKEYISIIDEERKNLEKYIFESDNSRCNVSVACALKKNTECKYKCICFKDVPKYNTSYNYINFRTFKDENGTSYDKYDLINNRYYKFDDVPRTWIKSENQIIQRDCYDNNNIYADKEKIKSGLNFLKYPIYHLDFETFPCPLPRFKGEKPYTQSCFEFSLHIENSPDMCDKEKNNFIFLAETLEDERENLVKALIENIDGSKGTMLAQNVGFEKSRIKELSEIFPEYKEKLIEIYNIGFDLLYLIRNNESLYSSLGFDEIRSKKINYYNILQSGSYSIKKTLPLFTNLKYSDLEIQNGTEALVEYSRYNNMTDIERKKVQENLRVYCKQDTWAMVEILKGLRELVK